MSLDDFTYEAYSELLLKLDKSKENVCFRDFKKNDKVNLQDFYLVRHDVDFSPEAALAMAQIEADLGIYATYFVLLSSGYYNLLSKDYIAFPKQLVDLGHEVGLHYDGQVLRQFASKNPEQSLHLQAECLFSLTGIQVSSIAMHNPSISGEDPFEATESYVNAYHKRFTQDINYISDSCGAWRDEALLTIQSEKIKGSLQLLIHPIFWNETSRNRWASLKKLVELKETQIADEAKLIEEVWINHTGRQEHDTRLQQSPNSTLRS